MKLKFSLAVDEGKVVSFSGLTGVMIKNTAKMYLVPDSKISPLL